MKQWFFISLAVCLDVVTAIAQQPIVARTDRSFDRRSTLDYYLQQSDWVVVGILKTPVTAFVGGGPMGTPDHPSLSSAVTAAEIEVQEVIKGKLSPETNLLIELHFFWVNEGMKPATGISLEELARPQDPAPFGYRQGAKYIFFLQTIPANQKSEYNGKAPFACTADPWFGVLPFSDTFALGLKQAVADPKK